MSTTSCHCGALISDDRYACPACAATAKADLLAAAPFLAWLDDKRARRGAIRLGGGGGRSAETPLPYDQRVGNIAGPVVTALHTWARTHQAEHFDHPTPPAKLTHLAVWLSGSVDWASTRPWACDAFGEYEAALTEMHRLFDVPPDREAIGECGTDLGDYDCPEFLSAEAGAEYHDCPRCGTRHNVKERREALIKQAGDLSVAIPEAVRLLRINGHDVDRKMLHAVIRAFGLEPSKGLRCNTRGEWRSTDLYRLGAITDAVASLEHDDDMRRAVRRARRNPSSVDTRSATLSARR